MSEGVQKFILPPPSDFLFIWNMMAKNQSYDIIYSI